MNNAFFLRGNAAEYISERLGRKVSTGAMHRHASDGTGPKYVMILGRASYTKEWLDEWLVDLVKAPAPRRRARECSQNDAAATTSQAA